MYRSSSGSYWQPFLELIAISVLEMQITLIYFSFTNDLGCVTTDIIHY